MANLILTRPKSGGGGGTSNAFETIISGAGSVSAVSNDTLSILGGSPAITTSIVGSPKTLVINFNPSAVNLGELGDVIFGSPLSDGYTLVYRTSGSPLTGNWFAEPSTTTDEFVKVSATDTTTGHLDIKVVSGTYTTSTILNPGTNESLQIDVDPSTINLGDLGDVVLGSPVTSGDLLGFDGTNWIPTPAPTVAPGGIEVTIINGQPIMTYLDTSRGSPGKRLSIAEQPLVFAENNLTHLDWVRIGQTVDADSGFIADLDGTVTYATGHCENTNANSKDIHLFVNGVDNGSIGTLSGGANVTFINTTIDIDFSQGDRIRLQAQDGSGAAIQDTVIKLTVKWRG